MATAKTKLSLKQNAPVFFKQKTGAQVTTKNINWLHFHDSNERDRVTYFIFTPRHKNQSRALFESWCDRLNSVNIDLQRCFNPNADILKDLVNQFDTQWLNVVDEFMEAIKEHKELQKTVDHMPQISNESAKRFLLLVPMVAGLQTRVYVDSTNGCLNMDVSNQDKGLLSTQISENGYIHYSFVSKNRKIYKITGTAKFKDPKDFINFSKVLQMT